MERQAKPTLTADEYVVLAKRAAHDFFAYEQHRVDTKKFFAVDKDGCSFMCSHIKRTDPMHVVLTPWPASEDALTRALLASAVTTSDESDERDLITPCVIASLGLESWSAATEDEARDALLDSLLDSLLTSSSEPGPQHDFDQHYGTCRTCNPDRLCPEGSRLSDSAASEPAQKEQEP